MVFYSFGALIMYVTFKDYFSISLIVAENLTKSYDSVVAVNSLNLSLDEDAITGLIGPNGAGKLTTIKMILGLLKPDKWWVKVFGQEPWDNTAIRSMIGVVYEKAFFLLTRKR
jgi:ABC-2 type transport system ATP-binding protein